MLDHVTSRPLFVHQNVEKVGEQPVEEEEIAEDECVEECQNEVVVELPLGEDEECEDDDQVKSRVRPLSDDLKEERESARN